MHVVPTRQPLTLDPGDIWRVPQSGIILRLTTDFKTRLPASD